MSRDGAGEVDSLVTSERSSVCLPRQAEAGEGAPPWGRAPFRFSPAHPGTGLNRDP